MYIVINKTYKILATDSVIKIQLAKKKRITKYTN